MTTTKSTRQAVKRLEAILNSNDELAAAFGKNLVTHLSLPMSRGECASQVVQTLGGQKTPTGLARVVLHVLKCSLD